MAITPTTGARGLGASVQRKEDPKFLTGNGRYTDDIRVPGALHLAMLRSPHAHARITRIDATRARDLPGVALVLTGEEAKRYSGRLATTIDIANKVPEVYAIAVGKVRYVGEPVAVVAAEDRYVAEDAVDLIDVEYEPLPPVMTIEDALEPRALLYEEWGDNLQQDWAMSVGDADEALAGAAHVFEEEITHSRYTGTPMEARACIADFNPATGELVVTCSTQAPSQVRTLIAQTLELPEHDIRVIAPDVGGGYGTKLQANAEVIPCIVSRALGRPVKWTEDRAENLMSGMQTRDYVVRMKVGLDDEHRIVAVKADFVANVGCDGTCQGPGTPSVLVAAAYLPGPYKVPVYEASAKALVTNKAPYGAYRGYGKDVANYPMERMMQIMAQRLGVDPAELRRVNYVRRDEFPYQSIAGPLYDSGDFERLEEIALRMIDYEAARRRQEELRREGRYIGIGIAAMLEPSGAAVMNGVFNGYQPATVRMTPEGGFQILTSHQNIGQGVDTTLPQVLANVIDVDVDEVRLVAGDTDATPYGLGPFSSRGATYTVSAVHEASVLLREKILRVAGQVLETSPEDLEIVDGVVGIKGVPDPERSVSLKQLGNMVHLWPGPYAVMPDGEQPNLEATYTWTSPIVKWVPDEYGRFSLYTTHPTGIFIAQVEVDVHTGRVTVERFVVAHDAGTLINPMIAEGQIVGGVAQGIGGALMEELAYGEDGRFASGDFQSYQCPTTVEIPSIEVEHIECPSPFTPLGTKGMGEGGTIPSPAAIANAVDDALAPLGVRIESLPITPERVLAAIGDRREAA